MRSNKSYVKETLAFVNKLRKQAGADPLDDIRSGKQSGDNCPISNSLSDVYETPYTTSGELEPGCYGVVYYGDRNWLLRSRTSLPMTRAATRFVKAFDAGRLPEYHI